VAVFFFSKIKLFLGMQKIAVFPGSFDPITKGHCDILLRALPLFDQIVIAIGTNAHKENYFSLEKRFMWIKDLFKAESKILVKSYEGLTIDFCKAEKANYLIRGLRTSADFEFERGIAQVNKAMAPEIETVFLISNPAMAHVTSSIVREIIRHGGDASQFVPNGINLVK
jgi:pantetheine-phosphate adenylyltransferase